MASRQYPVVKESKPRARLSEDQAITIFQSKSSASSAVNLARVYGVSEKAVRDIWKGRTWSKETWHLDTSRPFQLKLTGRPKGCKDKKPRKKKEATICCEVLATTAGIPVLVLCQVGLQRTDLATHPLKLQPTESSGGVSQTHENQQTIRAMPGFNSCITTCAEDSIALHPSDPSASCTEDSVWTVTCSAACVSVDEQLHGWDEFWNASPITDPFHDDWAHYLRVIPC